YTANNLQHGERRVAHRVYGARAGAENRPRLYGRGRPAARTISARGSHPDRHAGGRGGCGLQVQSQFLAAGAKGRGAGARNQSRARSSAIAAASAQQRRPARTAGRRTFHLAKLRLDNWTFFLFPSFFLATRKI